MGKIQQKQDTGRIKVHKALFQVHKMWQIISKYVTVTEILLLYYNTMTYCAGQWVKEQCLTCDESASTGRVIFKVDIEWRVAWSNMYSYSSLLEHEGSGMDTTSEHTDIYRLKSMRQEKASKWTDISEQQFLYGGNLFRTYQNIHEYWELSWKIKWRHEMLNIDNFLHLQALAK